MNSLDQKLFSANSKPIQRIQVLIIGRLFLIFVLLVASWLWNSGELKLSFDNFPRSFFTAFVFSVGLTLVYFIFLWLSKKFDWQVRVQFLLDALLITWLVWQTGDLTSPYITLYIVLIGVASVFLNSRLTLLIAGFCVCLFTILSFSVAYSLIDSFGATPEFYRVVQIVSFHNVAFLIVGLLASKLSDRRTSGEKLKETTKTLANLRVLHERIVESIHSGLITTDLDGKIYTFNHAAEEITKCKVGEMTGRSIYSIFGDVKMEIAASLEASENSEFLPRLETDFITKNNLLVKIGYSASPLFSEDGEKTGIVITFQDLTEIRTMEDNIRRKDRLAAVGRVAAGLAHEIRNPLGAMRGAIQVLESQTAPDSSQAKLMDIILRESDRLNNIITNFLTYARPRVSNFSEIDVREAISDTIMLLKHSPDILDGHELEAEFPDIPVTIFADSTQLKQIFWNLARNAIQAMPDGGTLKIKVQNPSSSRIRILFEDTGCGMSPEQVEQLFEPFSDSTTGGTGLGLSIVYQIVRDHNGTINVRSLENQGSTITIELPKEMKNPAVLTGNSNIDDSIAPTRLKDLLNVKNDESRISS